VGIKVCFILGRPSAPDNLIAMATGPGSLNISFSGEAVWNGVTVKFTLKATNLNDSTLMMVLSTQDHFFAITLPGNTSCDIYQFQVTARNDAGSSIPSDTITRSFPSLPDVTVIDNSLDYSLTKLGDGVLLTTTFNVRFL
jgi:hypothetical protein